MIRSRRHHRHYINQERGAKMKRLTALLIVPVAIAVCLLSLNVMAKEGPMRIWSPAFAENAKIPAPYTCDGQDKSPPLNVEGVPTDAGPSHSSSMIPMRPAAPGFTGSSGTSIKGRSRYLRGLHLRGQKRGSMTSGRPATAVRARRRAPTAIFSSFMPWIRSSTCPKRQLKPTSKGR